MPMMKKTTTGGCYLHVLLLCCENVLYIGQSQFVTQVSSSTFSLTAQQFWPQLDFRFQSFTHSSVWFVVTGVFSMEATALHDFTAMSEEELSFKKGSVIKVCLSNNNLWLSPTGQRNNCLLAMRNWRRTCWPLQRPL